ncbi:MAG: DUF2271 domain-containing protein [Marinosulfonomonas sp.]|nr:DUF2271 domain-containing protein [Marinosulfonomonas sp.]
MKTLLSALALSTAIALPGAVAAKSVTLTTEMKNYRGPGAYIVLYVTDASGAYQGSLWMAGGKSKYYKHLPGWFRATGGDLGQVSGITGASVGAGRTLTLNFDLADGLFDAGYKLHIDSSVEDGRDVANDVVVPLTSANAGKSFPGKRYISKFTFK